MSYIGRRRSLIDLLVDLALDAAVPWTGMRSQSPLFDVTVTVSDAAQWVPSADGGFRG